jgi:hypothetical protein
MQSPFRFGRSSVTTPKKKLLAILPLEKVRRFVGLATIESFESTTDKGMAKHALHRLQQLGYIANPNLTQDAENGIDVSTRGRYSWS